MYKDKKQTSNVDNQRRNQKKYNDGGVGGQEEYEEINMWNRM